MKEIGSRGISHDDVEHLLKIPIRRISLYDINRARKEMDEILARIKEINGLLKNIVAYAISCIDGFISQIKTSDKYNRGVRLTKIGAFEKVDVKEVVKKDIELKYDSKTGYVGTAVSGKVIAELSSFDRILVIRNNGAWSVSDLPEKAFVGPDAWWIGAAIKEELAEKVFTIIYKEAKTGYPCIKRCIIDGWIMNKDYSLVPEGATVLHIDTRGKFGFSVHYVPKPRLKVLKESFKAQSYAVRGLKAGGIRLAPKEVKSVET
jgi:topoisomerase-4 subunit A